MGSDTVVNLNMTKLTSAQSAAGRGEKSRGGEGKKNPLIGIALRPGARHRLGFGPELQPEEELGLLCTDDQAYGEKTEQPAQDEGEDTPSGLQQPPEDLKTGRWMGSSFVASSNSS